MRVLIYGSGVIGSLYASLLSEMEVEVSMFSRGKRLNDLQSHGLRYKKNNEIRKAKVTVISKLRDEDNYDFILLAVKENQLRIALEELKTNISPNIVTMVNSLKTRDELELICGKGRIIQAFPGAGGGFDGEVLDAELTPRIVQTTTIGMTDGHEKKLLKLFKSAKIPCQIVKDMHAWQICHLAMVVPIADAYYESDNPKRAGYDRNLMKNTANQIKRNLSELRLKQVELTPTKMKVIRLIPTSILGAALGFVFRSSFGDKFMYRHSMKAPDEMRILHDKFYSYIERNENHKIP